MFELRASYLNCYIVCKERLPARLVGFPALVVKKIGVKFVEELSKIVWGEYKAVFVDPDNNEFNLIEVGYCSNIVYGLHLITPLKVLQNLALAVFNAILPS